MENKQPAQAQAMKWLRCPQCKSEAKIDKIEMNTHISAKDPAVKEDFKFAFRGQVFLVCNKCNTALIDPDAPKADIITPDKKIIVPGGR